MEDHNSLSVSTEEVLHFIGGGSEKDDGSPIGVITNKERNIIYIGMIKNRCRDGYGVQFDGNQDDPILKYEGEWKEGKKVPGGVEYGCSSHTSTLDSSSSQEYISFYNLFTHLTINNSISLNSVVVGCIQNLIIANDCYSEDHLFFHEMKNLSVLLIGDRSCRNVQKVFFENLHLTRIEIGRNSFSGHDSSNKKFSIKACPLLELIHIQPNSFKDFSFFTIRYAPKLTEIIIGDRDLKEDSNSFSKVEVLNIEWLDSLRLVVLGNSTFHKVSDVYFNQLKSLKELIVGKNAMLEMTSMTLRCLPQLKQLEFGSTFPSLEELYFMNLDRLKRVVSPIPLSTNQIVYCGVNVQRKLTSCLSIQNQENISITYDFSVFQSYEKDDQNTITQQDKLKDHDFKCESVNDYKHNHYSGIQKRREAFMKQLQTLSYRDFIPDNYLVFFQSQMPANYIEVSFSSHSDYPSSVVDGSLDMTTSASMIGKLNNSLMKTNSSSTRKTNFTSTFDRSVVNSSQLLHCSLQLQGQLQNLFLSEASDVAELKIVKFPRLISIHIQKNSIPHVSLVFIHNNPMLQVITIDEGCGNGEIIEQKENEEFSKIVSITMNSSLKEISIGDYCFAEFDRFELNNVDFLEKMSFGTCSSQFERSGPIFGKVKSLRLLALPFLMTLCFGNNSFCKCEQLSIEGGEPESVYDAVKQGNNNNMNNLRFIEFGGKSFYSVKVVSFVNLQRLLHVICYPSSLYKCSQITLQNLNSFHNLTCMDESLCQITQIYTNYMNPLIIDTITSKNENVHIDYSSDLKEAIEEESKPKGVCKYCGNTSFDVVKPRIDKKHARIGKFIIVIEFIPFTILLCMYSILKNEYLYIPMDIVVLYALVSVLFFILDYYSKGHITCKKCNAHNIFHSIIKIG